jgi:hypothetical protein
LSSTLQTRRDRVDAVVWQVNDRAAGGTPPQSKSKAVESHEGPQSLESTRPENIKRYDTGGHVGEATVLSELIEEMVADKKSRAGQ